MIVASHVSGGGMDIASESKFAAAIRRIITERKPRIAIETGTHLGLGSTRAILSALPEYATFSTIECNPRFHCAAIDNLSADRCFCVCGLSVPRGLLPDAERAAALLREAEGA